MRLKVKIAIVTGGASGFGLGITQCYIDEGAKVLTPDIDGASVRPFDAALQSAAGHHAFRELRSLTKARALRRSAPTVGCPHSSDLPVPHDLLFALANPVSRQKHVLNPMPLTTSQA